MPESEQTAAQTPIGELVDFCRSVGERLNSIGFDPSLSQTERYRQAVAVMDEFLALANRADAAYADRADSAYIFERVQRAREAMSEVTRITAERFDFREPENKTERWMEALLRAKDAWLELDTLRSVPPDSNQRKRPPESPEMEKDPIPITWLRRQVPASKVAGDASKLAQWLKVRKVPVFKIAERNHAEREELLRVFRAGSRVHELLTIEKTM